MDLIYADSNLIDQGVLQDYSFDQCSGKDEQDFSCKIQKYNIAVQGDNPITQDFVLYIDNTDIGGIIDRVESDTKSGEITFKGRTWEGVLNSYVIEPPAGQIYRTYSGNINNVLAQMVSDVGMGSLFEVDTEVDNDFAVTNFQVRYEKLYDAILRMMDEYGGKLICFYHDSKVTLFGVLAVNYALNEEFDSSQVPFKVGYTHNNVNHLICLGQGDGTKRAVIHLFTDDGGTIQNYKLVANPLEDSEYILDKRNKIMTGKDEIAAIYDYPSAEIRENYKPLTSAPANWRGVYYNYYRRQSGTSGYELVPREYKDEMWLTDTEFGGTPPDWYVSNGYTNYYKGKKDANTGKVSYTKVTQLSEAEAHVTWTPSGGYQTPPPDWNDCWDTYYVMTMVEGQPTYSKAQGKPNEQYIECADKPTDWDWNCSSYYYKWNDGVNDHYDAVQAITIYDYPLQKTKPTDWNTNFGSYFFKQTKTKTYKMGSGNNKKKFKKGEYYTVQEGISAGIIKLPKNKSVPTWKKKTFHTKTQIGSKSPDYAKYKSEHGNHIFYLKKDPDSPPDFVAGKFFKRELDYTPQWISRGEALALPSPDTFEGYYKLHPQIEQIPEFKAGQFFYQVLDRYAELVRGGLKRLEELCDTSSLNIDLELASDYDVGDIVGSTDDVTGISVNKMILRKIVKIKKYVVSIDYEVE